MERIFIDREWCAVYVLLALESIENSANKERSINDFIKEINVMFDIYKDDLEMKNIKKKLSEKFKNRKIVME